MNNQSDKKKKLIEDKWLHFFPLNYNLHLNKSKKQNVMDNKISNKKTQTDDSISHVIYKPISKV